MLGFWTAEIYPFGPVQLYVEPFAREVLNCIVFPAQIGEFPEALGVTGNALTTTFIVEDKATQFPTVAVTE